MARASRSRGGRVPTWARSRTPDIHYHGVAPQSRLWHRIAPRHRRTIAPETRKPWRKQNPDSAGKETSSPCVDANHHNRFDITGATVLLTGLVATPDPKRAYWHKICIRCVPGWRFGLRYRLVPEFCLWTNSIEFALADSSSGSGSRNRGRSTRLSSWCSCTCG